MNVPEIRSAAAHCGDGPHGSGLLDLKSWRAGLAGRDWRETLLKVLDRETLSAAKFISHRGRPLGSYQRAGETAGPLPVPLTRGPTAKEAENR